MAKAKAATEFNFEQALERLESLVTALEEGDLSLEDSLRAFEQGIQLTRECQSALQEAELKVQKLVNDQGDTTPIEFGAGDDA